MHNKEDMEHALFSCQKLKNLPENVLKCLKISGLTQTPVTAPQLILYDQYASAKLLINAVWLLLVGFILENRLNKAPNKAEQIAKKIKEILISTNSSYPNRDLARECRKLELYEFLASHQKGKIPHWTTFQPNSKL